MKYKQNGFALLEIIIAAILTIILVTAALSIVGSYHRSQRDQEYGANFGKIINATVDQLIADPPTTQELQYLNNFVDLSSAVTDPIAHIGYPIDQASIQIAAQDVAQMQIGCPYQDRPNSIWQDPSMQKITQGGYDYYLVDGKDPTIGSEWVGYVRVPQGTSFELPPSNPTQSLDGYALLPETGNLASKVQQLNYTGPVPSEVKQSPAICTLNYSGNRTIVVWYKEPPQQKYFYCAYQPYSGTTPYSQSLQCLKDPQSCAKIDCATDPTAEQCQPVHCDQSKSKNHCALACQIPLFDTGP